MLSYGSVVMELCCCGAVLFLSCVVLLSYGCNVVVLSCCHVAVMS